VKTVGEAAMQAVSAERVRGGPFVDLHEFAERVDLKSIGKRAFENLARAGAFDGLGADRSTTAGAADMIIRYSAQIAQERTGAQVGLFDGPASPVLARPRINRVEEKTSIERLNEERAALGFYFSGHPLDDYEQALRRLNVISSSQLAGVAPGQGRSLVALAGVIRSVRMRRSKSGRPFAFVELTDREGEFEMTVFADQLGEARDLLESGRLVLVRASAEERDGETRLTAETIVSLDAAAAETVSVLRVSISDAAALPAIQRRLASVKAPSSGRETGRLVLALRPERSGREVELSLADPVACTPAMRSALKNAPGVLDVELI
jgi:DNA polymerase-3 subunit alpha